MLTSDEAFSIRAPIESARTLPRRAFTSPEFLQHELDSVFHRNWVGLCIAGQVSSPGDILPVDEFGIPLLVTHGADGKVRVFHNVCPYDGCMIATERSSGSGSMTVKYHGWKYNLEGDLLEAPYWNGHPKSGVDSVPEEHRKLVEVASGVSLGVVFVDLSGKAGPLADHLKPLMELLSEYDLDDLAEATNDSGQSDHFVAEAQTNWKTIAENSCLNILHESFTHALYRQSPDVPRVDDNGNPRFEIVEESNVFGFSYLESDVLSTYPDIALPHIGRESEPKRGYFLQLYPNVDIMVMSTIVSPNLQLPMEPGKTKVTGTILMRSGAAGSESSSSHEGIGDGLLTAAMEDAEVTDAIQNARRSPAYEQNFYSPFWDQPHYQFTKRVVQDLLAG